MTLASRPACLSSSSNFEIPIFARTRGIRRLLVEFGLCFVFGYCISEARQASFVSVPSYCMVHSDDVDGANETETMPVQYCIYLRYSANKGEL